MSDEYRGLAVFVAVADSGSFSAAGRRLKISTSVVSHHISKLEARLGVPLLFRSTRSLSLTNEGVRIIEAARRMVEAGEEALDALTDYSEQPVGALRVTLPAFGTSGAIHEAIWSFTKEYPMIAMTLRSSDSTIDLVREGFDLAIRLGSLPDSTLKSRRIGTFHRKIVAAPEFLASHGPIRALEDLVTCDFISLSMISDDITLHRDGEAVTITPESFRVEVDSVTAGKAATLKGLGAMNLPLNEIKHELESGALVELLPAWSLPAMGIYVVWPDSGTQKKLTRRLIDYLAERQDSLII